MRTHWLLVGCRVDLEVIKRSGTPKEVWLAERVGPVLARPHFLLATLLLCNSAAMEALPLFLDRLLNPAAAIILSGAWVQGRPADLSMACSPLGSAAAETQLMSAGSARPPVPQPACAWLLAVSAILVFGEILPQAVCKRYGLQVGGRQLQGATALVRMRG